MSFPFCLLHIRLHRNTLEQSTPLVYYLGKLSTQLQPVCPTESNIMFRHILYRYALFTADCFKILIASNDATAKCPGIQQTVCMNRPRHPVPHSSHPSIHYYLLTIIHSPHSMLNTRTIKNVTSTHACTQEILYIRDDISASNFIENRTSE